jgi:hypothetical protein
VNVPAVAYTSIMGIAESSRLWRGHQHLAAHRGNGIRIMAAPVFAVAPKPISSAVPEARPVALAESIPATEEQISPGYMQVWGVSFPAS